MLPRLHLAGLLAFASVAGCEPEATAPADHPPVMVERTHSHRHVHGPGLDHGHAHPDFPTGSHTHAHSGH